MRQRKKIIHAKTNLMIMISAPGGGGGTLPLEVVPDARESPSKKHPKRGFNGIPRDILNHMGQFPHPK